MLSYNLLDKPSLKEDHEDMLKLNKKQVEKLSDISSDLGLISVASVILPAAIDKFNPSAVGLGGTVSLFFWILSLWLQR